MPKFKFTDSFLRKKHNQNTEYSDEYISGLRIRIRNNHKKVFSYQYSLNGKKRRLTIGQYPYITLKQARNTALKAKVDLLNGIDPHAKKDGIKEILEQGQGLTIEEGLATFIERYVRPNIKSWKQYQGYFDKLDKKIKKMCIIRCAADYYSSALR